MRYRWRHIVTALLVWGLAVLPLAHAFATVDGGAGHESGVASAAAAHSDGDCHGHVAGDMDGSPEKPAGKADLPCKFCGLSHCFSVTLPNLPDPLPSAMRPTFSAMSEPSFRPADLVVPPEPPRATT